MILDLNHTRLVIPTIVSMTKDVKTAKERYALLSRITIATGAHIVAVTYYLSELYGMDEYLQSFLTRRQKDFYGVDDVIGVCARAKGEE